MLVLGITDPTAITWRPRRALLLSALVWSSRLSAESFCGEIDFPRSKYDSFFVFKLVYQRSRSNPSIIARKSTTSMVLNTVLIFPTTMIHCVQVAWKSTMWCFRWGMLLRLGPRLAELNRQAGLRSLAAKCRRRLLCFEMFWIYSHKKRSYIIQEEINENKCWMA